MRAALDHPAATGFLVTIGVLAALLLSTAVKSVSTILVYILLALFLAIALDPLVRFFEHRRLPRSAGTGIVFGGFALLIVAFLFLALPPVIAQVTQFVEEIPRALAAVPDSEWFDGLAGTSQVAVSAAATQLSEWLIAPSTIAALGGGILAIGVGVVTGISAALIIGALTLYFLASLQSTKEALYRLAPARSRPQLAAMTDRVIGSVGSSLIGSVTLSTLNAAVVFVLHLVIGLQFPMLMAR